MALHSRPQHLTLQFLHPHVHMALPFMCVVRRQRVLGALLQASPEQMLQACRTYPELLSRDPTTVSGTIDSIARHLQIPQVSLGPTQCEDAS